MNKQRFPYQNNTFDTIYSREVIGSLMNPQHFLKECYRTLKKGGKIWISADNAGVYGLMTRNHHGGYDKEHGEIDRCFYLFTATNLKNLIELCGFKKVDVRYEFLPHLAETKETVLNKTFMLGLRFLSLFSEKWKPNLIVEAYK